MIFKSIPITFFLFFSVFGFSQIQESWYGHYKGDLVSTNAQGNSYTYNMELVFKPITDSTWYWTLIYGEDSLRQERDYTLIFKDSKYYVDENNGIVLENNLFKNQFSSFFEVDGNFIHATYFFVDGKLEFMLTSSIKASVGVDSGDDIPVVSTFSIIAFQTAILKKI